MPADTPVAGEPDRPAPLTQDDAPVTAVRRRTGTPSTADGVAPEDAPRPPTAPDRRLYAVVGAVVAAAGLLLVASAGRATTAEWYAHRCPIVSVTLLVACANAAMFRIRYRSTRQGLTATSAAVIVGIALLPPHWVVLTTALGVALGKAVRRISPLKSAFNVGKDALAAGGAAYAAYALGLSTSPESLGATVRMIAVATIGYIVLDTALGTLVLALDSATPLLRRLLTHWDIRLTALAGNVVAASAAIGVWHLDPLLIVTLPPLLVASQFTYASRLRARSDRRAWRTLAQATDEFTTVDLDAVVRTAVVRAAELFSADEVDVEIRLPDAPPRLVRGDAGGPSYDGPPPGPDATGGQVVVAPLESHAGRADLGEVRLRFRGGVVLSSRERYTLRTFAAALCTAVRGAATSERTRRMAEAHTHAAGHDPVTGLPNRTHVLEYGQSVLDRAATDTVAMLLLDLNQFKEVNDTLGHTSGDRVLAEVGARLTGGTRPGDMVCRLGGDEFAVLLVGLSGPEAALARARDLLTSLDQPIELSGMRIAVEASGGLAMAPASREVNELLRRADVAMYQAKRSGRRIVAYDSARDTADIARLTLGGDLPRAMADQEFTVVFQPIVNLGTGEIVSAEALTRWMHPDRGPLTPHRFLDSVERSGLLPAFAKVVFDQTLQAAARWRAAGFDLAVAVNVSPRSLLDPRFPEMVEDRLRAHEMSADRLVIELTESLTLSELEIVDRVLARLREMGLQLALDDFGTGYSSLATLARVPVHELKIDRAFVVALDESPEATAVVRSTIELARSLDLLVVAEGVESARQRARLWELGCPAGQGHLFSRPLTAERMLVALREGTGGRPGALAEPLAGAGAVIRLQAHRRSRRAEPG